MKMLDTYNGTNAILQPQTISAALANQIGDVPRREIDAGKGSA